MTDALVESDPRFRTDQPASFKPSSPMSEVTAEVKAGGLDVFDLVFFALVAVVTTAGPWLREAGALGFGAFAIGCLIYATLRKTLFEWNWFLAFSCLGVSYALLSYLSVFPKVWTLYHEPSAIPLQSAFVWTFYPILAAFRAFFVRTFRSERASYLYATLFVLNLTVSPFLEWMIAPLHLQDQGVLLMVFSNLMNSEAAMFLSLAHLTMARRNNVLMYTAFLFTIASLFLDISIQIYISLVMFVSLHLRPLSRWVFSGSIVAFTLAYVFGVLFVEMSDFVDIDRNTAIRAYMLFDAIDLFLGSYGLGIGFGKELVSNIYLTMDIMTLYNEDDIILGGVHNSFISMFARLGLIGGVLFALAVVKTAWPSSRPTPVREPAYFAFVMAYVSCWVNVGVESPLASIGTALLLGYVMAARDFASNAEADGAADRTADGSEEPVPRHA